MSSSSSSSLFLPSSSPPPSLLQQSYSPSSSSPALSVEVEEEKQVQVADIKKMNGLVTDRQMFALRAVLGLRPKAANRTALGTDVEAGGMNPIPVGLGDSFITDGLSGVRKSSSTSNLQDHDSSSSAFIWSTSKWSLKPDLQAFSTAAIRKPYLMMENSSKLLEEVPVQAMDDSLEGANDHMRSVNKRLLDICRTNL
ncbi:uncharacterized protein Pyn_18069 [Prunus yedoensis var. nudiflora]|uniref:Uncharacterized protein n=1 Tax=Prunus yedoensis var. nudiflora TaxID=2094558 RepID=A0A314Y3B7_PRUYE|nr:uncharacterized protein Pyn_18069 [Prunus yedoensis var. nudiflora]